MIPIKMSAELANIFPNGAISATRMRGILANLRNSSFARDAFAAFAVNALGALTVMVGQVLLARWMGVQEYGIFAYAFSWLSFFTLLALAGLDNTSLRFIGAYTGVKESGLLRAYLSFAQRRIIFVSIGLATIAGAALLLFGRTLGAGNLVVFFVACCLLPWNTLVQFYASILQGFKRVVWSYALQGVLRPALIVLGVATWVALSKTQPEATTVMVANLLVAVLACFTMGVLWRRLQPQDGEIGSGADRRPEWLGVSRGMFAMSASQFLLAQSDILLVGLILGTTQAGIYAVASRLAGLVTFGIHSINSVLAPTIAGLHARGEHEELQRTVTLSSWCVVAYTIPVILVLAVTGRLLLGLFGPAFVAGYSVTLLLAVGQFVVAMAGSVGFLLMMTGHQKDAATVVASSSVLALLLVAVLTPLFGLPGAALGTMLATCARSSILCYLVKKRLNILAFAFHVSKGARGSQPASSSNLPPS